MICVCFVFFEVIEVNFRVNEKELVEWKMLMIEEKEVKLMELGKFLKR